MIIAHNPGLQDLTLLLSGSGGEDDLALVRTKFPTAALAQIDFATDRWTDIAKESGHLARFVTPRILEAGATD